MNKKLNPGYSPVAFDATACGPLTGVRVIDVSRLVAGNMLSLQLADFGADVIKVEPPGGDPLRHWQNGGESLHWKTYGRNKRSVMLNVRQLADKGILENLIEKADVFIENYRPGTLEKMGLTPDVLLARNPDLIIVRISGFGQTGPYAKLPGFGTLVEAMSGFAARTGFPDREPVLPPLALADMIAGLYGVSAVTMALLARQQGQARGQVIDLSLLESIFSVLGPEAAIYNTTGAVKERIGSASNTTAPRNVYACADGKYVALSGSTQGVAQRIFQTIGRDDMNHDPRFMSNTDRVHNRSLVDEALGAWFIQHSRSEALSIMRSAGATVGPVYDIADAAEDRHFLERGVFIDVEDKDLGSVAMHNIVPRFSGTPGIWRRPAPRLGEHTEEVLREAGIAEELIQSVLAYGGAA
ncbi:CoA transferase [Castellaniella sp.]|uniref:CaiB/BaiF CoA transferase family protein n=1 Tax=Castellaniella sp. TaxID=1955812 RepID=UPI002AFDE1E4|nr:CoA transferase [Castellaniella sp.]